MTTWPGMNETAGGATPRNWAPATGRSVVVCMVLAALAALIPIVSVRFPPMTDYANHYVRLWMLSGGIDRPQIGAIYQIDWTMTWTNIAIDLIAAALCKIASMAFIGPFVLALGLLLPPVGVALLNRKLFGGFHWWQLFCFTLAWNAVYLFGFINYSISLGLALLLAYLDECLRNRDRIVVFATRAVSASLLLVAHPFGLLFYMALLAALQFGPTRAPLRDRRAFLAMAGRVIVAVLPVLVPLVALFLFGPSLPGDKGVSLFAGMRWTNAAPMQAALLLTYITTYDIRVDIIYMIIAVVLVRVSAKEATLQLHWGIVLSAIVICLVSAAMPTHMLDTGGMDNRLPCMTALAAAAGLRPDLRGRPQQAIVLAILLVVLSRTAFIGYVWTQRSADVAAVEKVLENVPPGTAVLPLQNEIYATNIADQPIGRIVGGTYPSFWHYPSLAVMEREAFVPYLFTARGKQPLRVRAPWSEIAVPEGGPVPAHLLNEDISESVPYMKDWNARFDYLLLMNADIPNPGGPMPEIANVHLVADQGFARLYKIDHPAPPLR
jgi:hypothetical protein